MRFTFQFHAIIIDKKDVPRMWILPRIQEACKGLLPVNVHSCSIETTSLVIVYNDWIAGVQKWDNIGLDSQQCCDPPISIS